jgi:hypothetical protein
LFKKCGVNLIPQRIKLHFAARQLQPIESVLRVQIVFTALLQRADEMVYIFRQFVNFATVA